MDSPNELNNIQLFNKTDIVDNSNADTIQNHHWAPNSTIIQMIEIHCGKRTTFTQYGAGGGSIAGTNGSGSAGGSGIVIVRYLGSQIATGGTITSSGGYTIHSFTGSGTFTANVTSFVVN